MFDLAVMYHFHAILQIPANFFIFFKFFTIFITIQKRHRELYSQCLLISELIAKSRQPHAIETQTACPSTFASVRMFRKPAQRSIVLPHLYLLQ